MAIGQPRVSYTDVQHNVVARILKLKQDFYVGYDGKKLQMTNIIIIDIITKTSISKRNLIHTNEIRSIFWKKCPTHVYPERTI